jgi:hypothetical protein
MQRNDAAMRRLVTVALGASVFVAHFTAAWGDILAGWDFEGCNAAYLAAPSYAWATTNVTVSQLTDTNSGFNDARLQTVVLTAVNLTPLGQDNFYRFSGWSNSNTPPAAIATSNYFQWTIAPKPGYRFALDPANSLRGSLRFYDSVNDNDDIVVLRSSLDGFTANLDTVSAASDGALSLGAFHLDVGPGFTNLTSAVTFRLYCTDPDSSVGNLALRPDENVATGALAHLDLVINGKIELSPPPAGTVVKVR